MTLQPPTSTDDALSDEDRQVAELVDRAVARFAGLVLPEDLPVLRMALAELFLTNPVATELLEELRLVPAVDRSGERTRRPASDFLAAMERGMTRRRGGKSR